MFEINNIKFRSQLDMSSGVFGLPGNNKYTSFRHGGTGNSTAGLNTELIAISSMSEVRSEHKFCFGASLRHTKSF
jgi:hypothetical protein